jgi:hypothetical protein
MRIYILIILTILSHPTHGHGIYVFGTFKFFLATFYTFQCTNPVSFVTCVPIYFILFVAIVNRVSYIFSL